MAIVIGVALLTAGCATEDTRAPAASATASASAVPSHTAVPTDPPASPLPAVLVESRPVRLLIPSIGVDTHLMDLGLQDDGTLEVPTEGFPAGWFTGAPTPGERGPAVLAGHVDWGGSPGVFHRLHGMVPGDEVSVLRADGSTAVFVVQRVERFAKDAFPTDAVYGDLDHSGLRLITCGGSFDEGAGSYDDNVVVFADLLAAAP